MRRDEEDEEDEQEDEEEDEEDEEEVVVVVEKDEDDEGEEINKVSVTVEPVRARLEASRFHSVPGASRLPTSACAKPSKKTISSEVDGWIGVLE